LVYPWCAGGLGLLSLYLSRRWVAFAPTLTVCDLLIMIMGQLASFGLPWWRRAGRQTRVGVTPRVSAIVTSACLRPFLRSSVSPAGLVVKGVGSAPFRGFLAARLCVAARRGQPRSSSLRCGRSKLTAAARDGVGDDRGIPLCGQVQRSGS
jgi:hypothetical protein